MTITTEKILLEITIAECRTLYSTIKHGLEDRINDHWKHHPDSYQKMESERLHMLQELGRFTGNDFVYDSSELLKLLKSHQTVAK